MGDELCLRTSLCDERCSDSPNAAIIAYLKRKLCFDGFQPRAVQRNEKELH
jgi:hypothetical protein